MGEVSIFRQISEVFDGVSTRKCDEVGRACLEDEIEEAINNKIRTMLGYDPMIRIKPVIALDKATCSAILEDLKIVPASAHYIDLTLETEGGDCRG